MSVNAKTIDPYIGKPDIKRLIAAFKRQPVDRVPNFEVLYEDQHVEKFLGRYAGNTLAYGGDPAKGVVDPDIVRPMFPDDFIDLCEIIGQDAMVFDAGIWAPFKRKDASGKLVAVADRSIKTRKDFESLILDSDRQINDFVWPADDVAFKTGLFIPPKIMKEIWVPRMARIMEPAVNAGIPVMFHSDGKIDDMVEDLIEMGLNCLNPMDPYGIDYREYKKKYGSRLCLSGNVDIEFPLSKGTPEDIDKDVKEHMDILKPGYGYVATCSHSIVNYIPHENVIAYLNAIHKYGIY
jgi:hypothetical protein